MKTILKVITINLIPSILIFIGKHDGIFLKLIKSKILESDFDIKEAQFWSFMIGILWVGLIVPIQFELLKNKMKNQNSQFDELITYHKNSLLKLAKEEVGDRNIELNTRVFKIQGGMKGFWNRIKNKKKFLIPHQINGITDPLHTNDIKFNILDPVEGMVGKSFIDQAIIMDFDLTNQNKYYLSPQQKTQVAQTKFCTTVPIFDKNNEVSGVLSIDSDQPLNPSDDQKNRWKDNVIYYAAFVNKYTK